LARNGRDALAQFEAKRPDACFLDIHMSGMSGLDAAQDIGEQAHLSGHRYLLSTAGMLMVMALAMVDGIRMATIAMWLPNL
jgi:CheY-like chemotaxis protein